MRRLGGQSQANQSTKFGPAAGRLSAIAAFPGQFTDTETAMSRVRQLKPQWRIADFLEVTPFGRLEGWIKCVEGFRTADLRNDRKGSDRDEIRTDQPLPL